MGPQETLEKRFFGTTKKKLAWAFGTAGLVVSVVVICLFTFMFGSGKQEKVGLQGRVKGHTVSGRLRSGAQKPKSNPDGRPIAESSTASSESITEEEVAENLNTQNDRLRSKPEERRNSTETDHSLKARKTTADGFKKSKDIFLTKARNAILDPAAKVDQLKSQFGLVVQKLDDVKKTSDADFNDPDDPKIAADSKFDDFMGSYFANNTVELIPEFDKKFTTLCAAGDAKALETLFNHWLSWMTKSKVSLAGETGPEWIKCKSFVDARKWFAASNPNILTPSERFNAPLNSLKNEGIIMVQVPSTVAEQTVEAIADILIDLKERGQNDKAKKVMEEFRNANAGDAKKVEMVTKMVATQSAVNETLKFIKNDSAIDRVFKMRNPKALKQIEEAKTIEQVFDAINSTFGLGSSKKTPSSVLVKAFGSYLKAKGENETVLKALQTIQDSMVADKVLNAEEKMHQANAWTEVIVNIREESDLKMLAESAAKSENGEHCFSSSSGYPCFLLSDSNQEYVEFLRISAKEQTNCLAKANSVKEFLKILSQIDLSHFPHPLNEYLQALSFSHGLCSNLSSGLDDLTILIDYDNGDDKTGLLRELLEKRLKRVPKVPKCNNTWHLVPMGLRSFAKHFEEVGDMKEAEEWRAFAVEADLIFSLGLPNETKYERVFNDYRSLKECGVTEEGLSNFLNLLLTLELEYKNRVKFLLSYMVSSKSPDIIQMIFECSAELSDKQAAQNIIKCKDVIDYSLFHNGKHLYFQVPFLIGVLDDEVVKVLCKNYKHPFSIPSNLGFKETVEFKNFVNKQAELFRNLPRTLVSEKLDKIIQSSPDFAPNIGFMDWRILQNSQPYGAELIDAYEALANIMDAYADPALTRKMKEHAAQVKEECKKLS